MFALSRGVYNELTRKEEFFVVILGLDNAGKTSYVEQFKSIFDKSYKKHKPSQITSTVGLNLVKVDCGRAILNLWDVGGQEGLRSLWKTYLDECNAVIFVIDSSNLERFNESLECFDEVIAIERIRTTTPILILLNKCEQQNDHQNPSSTNISENHKTALGSDELTSLTNDSYYSPSTSEHVDKLREMLFKRLGSWIEDCDMALISISALENLNVQKSANWILDALLSQHHRSTNMDY